MSAITQTTDKRLGNFLNQANTADFLTKTLGARKSEFVSNLLAISDADKNLSQCDPSEVMKCAMNATALNLPLSKNLGYAYVIPYKDWKTQEVHPQFQIGYKGFVQLAIRSGQYRTINTCEVREGEIKRNKFTGHTEFLGENPEGKVIGYLAYIELQNGFQQSLYMTLEQVQEHVSKYSKSGIDKDTKEFKGIWRNEFDTMAKKTVLKLLLNRFGVLSVEMQQAIEKDQADSEGRYIDNPQGGRYVQDAVIIEQSEPTEVVSQEEPSPAPTKGIKQVDFKQM
ncbi:recombinase RecT [Capnocytophaga sp. oral taxon 338]|uniref:recombinase RecT n=1 Tax=Capnocytophaga sp. oral taxon 338 TaxID=710239 RepID=UPI000202D1A5|nr:recombinase RecT [Capnocytophaga sp. oral taxon 338]EGD33304.1 prophage pi1 protein 11 [Capnocytophaga sp. oral taxon 338 str. F0234]